MLATFSFFYIRLHRHANDKDVLSNVAAVLGLTVVLASCAIVPVDIFLVSFMKNTDGSYKVLPIQHVCGTNMRLNRF